MDSILEKYGLPDYYSLSSKELTEFYKLHETELTEEFNRTVEFGKTESEKLELLVQYPKYNGYWFARLLTNF